jgi:hypothetical protein
MPLFSYFDGNQMFDFAPRTIERSPQRGEQTNTYAGIDGTEVIDQGFRLWERTVSGILIRPNPSSLKAAENFWLTYIDGNLYTYTDWSGNSFGNVKLIAFDPEGPVRVGASQGYFRRSTIQLRAYTPN